ncbi:hypothetical protein HYALB_00010649 [Hymenoscyphus albidus]|uniref:Uncharacterized protein n=1 Tax=Hymenoscyphus albidus TaxID=595503 RepID=A0A9N9Q9X1_9HELO|nr:hypothetical protein HYALB_00010649 [Hymenoscyphus albidus]
MAFVKTASLFNFPEVDLPIIVTHRGQQITGRVSSKALCLASPVLEKFIYPTFGRLSPAKNEPPVTCTGRGKSQTKSGLEETPAIIAESVGQNECVDCDIIGNGVKNCKLASTKSNQEVAPGLMFGGHIDFQEDNAESLRLLFQIAHFQFNKVPLKLQFDTLIGIAHLCEIYQCVQLVLPWLDSWLEGGIKECAEAGKEEYLFIAWSFGRADLFTECANNLINEVYLIDGLPAVNRGFVRYLDDIEGLPPKAIGEFVPSTRIFASLLI